MLHAVCVCVCMCVYVYERGCGVGGLEGGGCESVVIGW